MRGAAIRGMVRGGKPREEARMPKTILRAGAAVLLAAGAPCSGALAQALPAWKITDICAHESAPGQCAAFERQAFNAVSASWLFVLEPTRQACLAQVRSPLDQSWRLLAECLDAQARAAIDKAAVQTARTPAEPVPPPRPREPPAPPPAAAPPPPAPPVAATPSATESAPPAQAPVAAPPSPAPVPPAAAPPASPPAGEAPKQ
ncbi:MAG TPA: hypothetical protein VFA64_00490 [Hyphomicrobiaceae bacterium]|nr:hypothetical protein [Hyphomicrobiaceae bacterium]